MARKQKELAPMQKALREVFEVGACDATAEQLLAIAQKYGVAVSALEGYYFDEVDRISNEDD